MTQNFGQALRSMKALTRSQLVMMPVLLMILFILSLLAFTSSPVYADDLSNRNALNQALNRWRRLRPIRLGLRSSLWLDPLNRLLLQLQKLNGAT
jgi:hypothetical protein